MGTSRSKKTTSVAPTKTSIQTPEKNQNTLMWAGVISCLLIITIVSGWAMKIKMASLRWETSPEKTLLDKTSYSWQKAINTTNEPTDLQKEIDKAHIKDSLNQILTTTTLSTSSTSF